MTGLSGILETTNFERVATGFVFTEGPLWHPGGFFYFVDVRSSALGMFAPDGTRIGIIETPEVAANIAFGGPDLRTLLFTASTSVYTLRVKTPGLPHPWYNARTG